MTARLTSLSRVFLICVLGAMACLAAHRFAYLIPLGHAYEIAVSEAPGCRDFHLADDADQAFYMECAPSAEAESSGELLEVAAVPS